MKKIILHVAFLLSVCGASYAQNKTSIVVKDGQKYIVENIIKTHVVTEIQGMTMDNNSDIQSIYSILVKKVSDSIHLVNTLTGMKMNMAMMGQEMKFDSEKPEDFSNPLGSTVKDIINKPHEVTISKTVELAPKSDTSTDEASSMVEKQIENFDVSGFGAKMAFMALPEKFKEGSSWSEQSNVEGISSTTNYTIKNISGDLVTITITGSTSTDTKMEQAGMEMTVKGKGTVTGEQVVNAKTGVIQSATTNNVTKGTVEAMGQEFPTTTTVNSTTTVKLM